MRARWCWRRTPLTPAARRLAQGLPARQRRHDRLDHWGCLEQWRARLRPLRRCDLRRRDLRRRRRAADRARNDNPYWRQYQHGRPHDSAGTLQLGNGGTTGSIVGNVADNATLAFDRSDAATFAGAISGSGSLQIGSGGTILTRANAYTGQTLATAGQLYVDGNESGATGPTSVGSAASLGGNGVIGGNVSIGSGGILAPTRGTAPGTLSINGAGAQSRLDPNYRFGQANVPGGPFNDLTNVGGNLALAGTLNVTQPSGGSFDPGVYRVFDYTGGLSGSGLTLGSTPRAAVPSSSRPRCPRRSTSSTRPG